MCNDIGIGSYCKSNAIRITIIRSNNAKSVDLT